MNKLPVFMTWHVGSSSCEMKPSGSRLTCDAVTIKVGFTVAEDGTLQGGRELHFKIGGEAPTEPNVGHIVGEAEKYLRALNETFLKQAVKDIGLKMHADLPDDLKKTVPDPSVPIMPPEHVERLRVLEQRKAEYGAKAAAKAAGDPNWMYATPDITKFVPPPPEAKQVAKQEPSYVKPGVDILDPKPKSFLGKLKEMLPWIVA